MEPVMEYSRVQEPEFYIHYGHRKGDFMWIWERGDLSVMERESSLSTHFDWKDGESVPQDSWYGSYDKKHKIITVCGTQAMKNNPIPKSVRSSLTMKFPKAEKFYRYY